MSEQRDFSSRPRRRPARPLDLALLSGGVLALLYSGYVGGDAWSGLRRGEARVEEALGESAATQARVRELEASRGTAQTAAYQALLTAEAPPPRVLASLAELMPGDVRLEAVSFSYANPLALQIDVSARNASSYDLFLDRLQRSPRFADVLSGEENRDGELRTSIQMTYRAP